MKSWLILGGCPRSGTTLLNSVINSHPKIALSNEQNLYKTARILSCIYYREKHVKTRIDRELSSNEKKIGAYESLVECSTIDQKKSMLPAIESLYSTSLSAGDSVIHVGDKYPKYYEWDLSWMGQVFPEMKFVHVTRSPVDVVNSCVYRTEMRLQGKDWWPVKSALEYVSDWVSAWNFAAEMNKNDNFHHIRYESFVANPKEEVENLAKFLGVEADFNIEGVYSKAPPSMSLTKNQLYKIERTIPIKLIEWNDDMDTLFARYPKLTLPNGLLDLESHFRRFQRQIGKLKYEK